MNASSKTTSSVQRYLLLPLVLALTAVALAAALMSAGPGAPTGTGRGTTITSGYDIEAGHRCC